VLSPSMMGQTPQEVTVRAGMESCFPGLISPEAVLLPNHQTPHCTPTKSSILFTSNTFLLLLEKALYSIATSSASHTLNLASWCLTGIAIVCAILLNVSSFYWNIASKNCPTPFVLLIG
jgi:hypothetical protein